jgi:hypothetical protein
MSNDESGSIANSNNEDIITIHKPGNEKIIENKYTKEEIKEKRMNMNRMVIRKFISKKILNLRSLFLQSVHLIILHPKFSDKMDMVKKLIGGL